MAGLLIIIVCVFLWSGFICAISFMESWLKFRAPGLTMPVGLSIGKLVFRALNRVEWFFTVVIIINIFLNNSIIIFTDKAWFTLIVITLLVQTGWLLPALNYRANAIIDGKSLPGSRLHWYFVIAEFVKLLSLILFGVSLLQLIIQLK